MDRESRERPAQCGICPDYGERLPDRNLCFHCQQVAEKYLKALLTFLQKPFPRTHDLILLANRLDCAAFKSLESLRDDLRQLNRYSVEARYPGEWEPISQSEAEDSLRSAMRVIEAVRSLLPREAFPPTSQEV